MLFSSVIISTTDPTLLQVLTMIVSVFAPILVGLVTKSSTASNVKAILLAAIAAVMGLITGFLNSPDAFDLWPAVLVAVQTFVISVATYYGLWQPTGVKAWAQRTLVKD